MILGKERIIEGIGKGVIRISSVDKTKPFDMGRQVQKSSIDLYLDLHDLITISPHSAITLKSRENISLPNNIGGNIIGRRSWMEKGVSVGGGFIQRGHTGQLKVIISNITDSSITIGTNDSIYQIELNEVRTLEKEKERIGLLSIIKDWASLFEYLISKRNEVEKPPVYPEVPCAQGQHWKYLQQGKEKGFILVIFSKILDFFWRLPIFLFIWWRFFISQGKFSFYRLRAILLFIIALLLYRGLWILLEWFKNLAEGAWKNHIVPEQKSLYPPSTPQLRTEWFPTVGVNLFFLFLFVIFIAYIELLFWYMAFFTIFGKSLVEAFGIFKAPIDVILFPITLLIYGEKDVFGLAISLAFVLEFWILFTLNFVQNGVESCEKSNNKEEKKSAISLIRTGFFFAFPAVLIEYGVMAIFAWRGGHQFNFPLWLIYILTVGFPIGEIIMTRGIETNLYLSGTKQKAKKYWGNIWKGIRIAMSKGGGSEV